MPDKATPGPATPADHPTGGAGAPRPRRRWRRIALRVLLVLLALLLAAVVGLVVWAKTGVMAAEEQPLAAVRANPAISWAEDEAAITLTPADGVHPDVPGLVFYPGAKVEAAAYAARLADLVTDHHMTVVIAKPTLNLALFDLRGIDAFTGDAAEVRQWLVGGHSLGGVRACMLAPEQAGLVLFASYCTNDLSEAQVPVLSLSGGQDGLSTPAKVADHRDTLPAGALMVEIPEANHAAFGDYGPQSGDGVGTASDEQMNAAITEAAGELLTRMQGAHPEAAR
ncbi:alpha/beta hydrolase [Corynebacterium sp. 13CS0277]|nr:alpha/beta hydrolase [Corynebacterium sp. 13CS0277]